MSHRSRFTLTALTLVAAGALAPQAQASGFQLREQSPSAQGTGFAGVSAGGSDISVMFFNPASMTQFSGWQFSGGGTLVAPTAEFSNGVATRVTTTTISGPSSHGNAAVSAVLPNLNLMYSASNDLKFGFSVNVPFGLTTEYDSNWIGRYHALKSKLKTIDLAPSIAYRVNPQWSVGAAFVARKADAELTSAVDFGLALNPVLGGTQDGTSKLTGSAWGYGFKVGATYQPTEAFRLGLAYHGAMTMTLKGDISFGYPATLAAPFVTALQTTGGLRNGGGAADLKLPATYSIGFNYDVSKAFSIQGEVARSTWSKFDELRVKFTSNVAPQQLESVTTEKWKDTTFISLGGTCKVGDWTYRVGLSHDTGAVDDAYRTPRIPDADRTWASIGTGYAFSKALSVDVAYSHLFMKDSTVGLTTSDPNNVSRGNLSGTYKSNINILGVNMKYSF